MTDESIERLKWLTKLPEPENAELADEYIRLIDQEIEVDRPSEVQR